MENPFIEAKYPIDFREDDAKKLGEQLRHRHSVDLVGMKRVGISNFLRFFLYNNKIVSTYINHGEKHVFIPVDLNDLIEKEIFPFWILTFKRIVDKAENLSFLELKVKKFIARLFLDSIQTKDPFLTLDGIRRSLIEISKVGVFPTIFFIRFDRLKDAGTPEFFNNLQGLRDATAQKLSYVFTSYRSLNDLVPSVFTKGSTTIFTQTTYIKPASYKDISMIFNTFKRRYQLTIEKETENEILSLSGGHVQYLQLSLIILKELLQANNVTHNNIKEAILQDERINLQSEELWESLSEEEKSVLLETQSEKASKKDHKTGANYLWDTGFIEVNGKNKIFSPIFESFLKSKNKSLTNSGNLDFSKKENMLFGYLRGNLGQICDREKLVEIVWPEYEELGVSDWAIDRLVARVRTKLKSRENPYEIVTVKTRGYKLLEK